MHANKMQALKNRKYSESIAAQGDLNDRSLRCHLIGRTIQSKSLTFISKQLIKLAKSNTPCL